MKLHSIHIRDPFILEHNGMYYLYGTPGRFACNRKIDRLEAFASQDLENWEGPLEIFRSNADFWADRDFWAPEVYYVHQRFYMFCSFKSPSHYRATQILVSDTPLGPFHTLTDSPITPAGWECLDGTLYVDGGGRPWLVFCHEWVQCRDGEIWAMELSKDLTKTIAKPVLLFRAADAPWTVPITDGRSYVTDGPFITTMKSGSLNMIWSSFGKHGYAVGQAVSKNGILGPWKHEAVPLFASDGGHGMILRHTILALHHPNTGPQERPVLHKLQCQGDIFSIQTP